MDVFQLDQIAELHAVATDLFVPFVIYRFGLPLASQEAVLDVELRGILNRPDGRHQLRLHWSESSVPTLPAGVSDSTVTEWAALGVASAVIWQYAGLRLSSVTMRGDRFDYWVRHDDERFGLEVSGTMTDELNDRHREKVAQLQANPFAVAGFVVVTAFPSRRVIFSFHQPVGVTP
jgi:hypothetical protein